MDAGSLSRLRLIWWFCVSRVTECHNPSFNLCPVDRGFEQFYLVGLEQFISIGFGCFLPYLQNCVVFVLYSSFSSLGKIYLYLKCYAWYAKYNWERERDIFRGQTVLGISSQRFWLHFFLMFVPPSHRNMWHQTHKHVFFLLHLFSILVAFVFKETQGPTFKVVWVVPLCWLPLQILSALTIC